MVADTVTQELMSDRTITITKVTLNGKGNTIQVPPGTMINITFVWEGQTTKKNPYCPTCILQMYFGLENEIANCFFSGIPGIGWKKQGLFQGGVIAPKAPGTYYLTRSAALDYQCKPGTKAPSDPKLAIGAVIVQ